MPESAPIVSAVLVHHVPGRVRLRIRKDNCNSLGRLANDWVRCLRCSV